MEGVTLVIEPGVQVRINQDTSLYIDGKLIARGLENNPILFTSNAVSPAPGDTGAVKFLDGSIDASWVVSFACQKPTEFRYSYELWTTRLLSKHIRNNCIETAGHPSLIHLSRGTVSKLLSKSKLRPHKIRHYLERRDPEFETKMEQVL